MSTTTMQDSPTSSGNGTAMTGLTAASFIQVSGTFTGGETAQVEASLDGGTTYSPVGWLPVINGPCFMRIDIAGPTYAVRVPVNGVRSGYPNTIKIVGGYA